MSITTKVKTALLRKFLGEPDSKGYTRRPEENLLPGIALELFEGDLRRGDGDELRMKFCAVHSSSALAVNSFAPFKNKDRIADLLLLGQQGAKKLEFEKKLRIFPRGKGPNIDVWIDRDREAVAVESKLLEYLIPKKPKLSTAYDELKPQSEPSWWQVYEEAKRGTPQHLERGQLIKHYFGLNELRMKDAEALQMTLLYIFWEPLNWEEVEECQNHRGELKVFANAVANSQIAFRWTTYNEIWQEWTTVPVLAAHAQNLKARYQLRL